MDRKALITFIILLITLLIGFGIGFLSHGIFVQQQLRPLVEGRSPEKLKERLAWVMGLDAQQQQATDSLVTRRLRNMRELMKSHGQEMRSEADSLFEEMKPYLKPEQMENLERTRQRLRRFLMPPPFARGDKRDGKERRRRGGAD